MTDPLQHPAEEPRRSRFVIATQDRCGGRMLQTALDRHPEIRCFDELFNVDMFPIAATAEPEGYLQSRLAESVARVTGFRLLESQPYTADDAVRGRIRRSVAALPGLRVILLRRENGLRQAVSREIAVRSRQWRLRPGEPRRVRSVRLRPEDLQETFRGLAIAEARLRQDFAHCPCLTVTYERLQTAFAATAEQVQRFLSVPPHPLTPQTRQQNPEPLRELLENFEELRSAFQGTVYAPWFDE